MRALLARWDRARALALLERARPWAVAAPGLLVLIGAWASFGGRLIDDSYISLTYARSLIEGDGLVFHPTLPRTEGYSNLLWTLLLALGMLTGASGAAVATTLGLVCAGAAVALVARRLGGARGAAAGLAIAASPVYGYWAGAGLEGPLVALLLVVAVLERGARASWIAYGLLGVTRVEGVAWGVVGVLHAIIEGRRLPSARALALWLGPTVAQLALRALYYGSLVPAPALAKTSEELETTVERGLGWLSGALSAQPLECLLTVGALAWMVRARWTRRAPLGAAPWASLVILGLLLFSVLVGGDWMPNLRWLVPAVPLVWLAVAEVAPATRVFVPVALLATLLGSQIGSVSKDGTSRARAWAGVGEVLRQGPRPLPLHPAHLFVLEYLGPDEAVLHPDVGALSFMTANPILDPQGLCWMDVARLLRAGGEGEASVDELARVEQTIRAMRPALIAIPFVRGSSASGPVSLVLYEEGTSTPRAWFAAGWSEWRIEEHNASSSLRYYLRADLARPGKEARLDRLQAALARVPEAEGLKNRIAWVLRQLDRDEEALRVEAATDPRARTVPEVWSR